MKAPKLKIDWSDKSVPKKANYLAMDISGTWFFYRSKPKRGITMFFSQGEFPIKIKHTEWKSTLQKRPKNKVKK